MKKQYIAPAMETALYEAETIIATSLTKDRNVILDSSDAILTKEDEDWDIWDE